MADIIVTTLDDTFLDDGQTSLREAIDYANQNAGADAITFADGLSGVIRLTNGALSISSDLSIDGANTITISGLDTGLIYDIYTVSHG
mgnify:CR=1 FL=1